MRIEMGGREVGWGLWPPWGRYGVMCGGRDSPEPGSVVSTLCLPHVTGGMGVWV